MIMYVFYKNMFDLILINMPFNFRDYFDVVLKFAITYL